MNIVHNVISVNTSSETDIIDITSEVEGAVASSTVFNSMDEALEMQLKESSNSEFFNSEPVDINIDVSTPSPEGYSDDCEDDERDENGNCPKKEKECEERDEDGNCIDDEIDEEYSFLNDENGDGGDRIAQVEAH